MRGSPVILAAGIFLILAGVVWILQGLDVTLAPDSFMTANRWWVLWGALAVGVGVGLVATFRKG